MRLRYNFQHTHTCRMESTEQRVPKRPQVYKNENRLSIITLGKEGLKLSSHRLARSRTSRRRTTKCSDLR